MSLQIYKLWYLDHSELVHTVIHFITQMLRQKSKLTNHYAHAKSDRNLNVITELLIQIILLMYVQKKKNNQVFTIIELHYIYTCISRLKMAEIVPIR